MVQTKPQLVSFDQFIEWYPEYSEFRIESHVFPDLHLTAVQLLNAKD